MATTGTVPHSTDTVFITGGSSGIGAGLASAFYARGATVIIGGRNADTLAAIANTYPGMETCVIDVSNATSVTNAARTLTDRHPTINLVINNAGIQRLVDFSADEPPTAHDIDLEIDTNLKGLMYVTSTFLPMLRRQPAARLVLVNSGLGFIPLLVRAPIYSASKAAVHAFAVAVREQLRGTSVQVIELIPPIVATNLHREQPRKPARAMPLDQFVEQAMRGLDSKKEEVPIGLARMARFRSRLAPHQFLSIINRSN